ncbi:MAG: putative sulfate exporter family transporter, partial [Gammaproteobacteria bacterium]|nr:putative sulfate exporter family transporter [Gammaproteobacteria bacterium]
MPRISEDWLAVWIGLLVFALAAATMFGVDLLGWSITSKVWVEPAKALAPVARGSTVPALLSLAGTYLLMLALTCAGAKCLGAHLPRFAAAFTALFALSVLCSAIGHYAYIAATPDKFDRLGITWSLNLTGESGYIIALLLGLAIANLLPRLAEALREAVRPELYVKIAIVIMGAALGVKSAETFGLAQSVIWRGLCAVVEAYLIYWAVIYYVARRYF